jgi:Uma2 family endonuclease
MNAIVRPADVQLAPVPVSAEALFALVESGLFADRPERIELEDGELVMAPPSGDEHLRTARMTNLAIMRALIGQGLDTTWSVQPECTLVLDDHTVLVPDLSVVEVQGPGLIAPRSALVVIEIAWSSYARDTGPKAARYAAAGVREYWVVDVAAKAVIVHTGPGAGSDAEGWAEVRIAEAGETVSPMGEPRLRVAVADLF